MFEKSSRECHHGLQGFSSGGFLVTNARGAGSSRAGGGVPQPELTGEKDLGSEEDEEASRGDRGTKLGTFPKLLAVIPAGRTSAMSPFASRVGTSRTPEPAPAAEENYC